MALSHISEVNEFIAARDKKREEEKDYTSHISEVNDFMAARRAQVQQPEATSQELDSTKPKAEGYAFDTRPQHVKDTDLGYNYAGVLWKGLEYLARPDHAVRSGIKAMFDDVDGNVLSSMEAGIKGEQTEYVQDWLTDFMIDSHRKYKQGEDNWVGAVIDSMPVEVQGIIAATIGTAGDILTSPLTFFGGGLTKAGRAIAIKKSLGKNFENIQDPKLKAFAEQAERELGELGEVASERLASGQSYVGFADLPGLRVPRKAASTVAKGFENLTRWSQNNKVGDQVWKMFSTTHGIKMDEFPRFHEMEMKFKDVADMARHRSVEGNKDWYKTTKEIARALDIEVDDVRRYITESVELAKQGKLDHVANMSPEAIKKLKDNPKVEAFVHEFSSRNTTQIAEEMAAGIKIKPMGESTLSEIVKLEKAVFRAEDKGYKKFKNPITKKIEKVADGQKRLDELHKLYTKENQMSYFRHSMRPEVREYFIKEKKLTPKQMDNMYNMNHPSSIQRKYAGMTVSEINDLAKAGKLPGHEGKVFKEGFFYEDPAVAQTVRDIYHRQTMAMADFVAKIKLEDDWAMPLLKGEEIPLGYSKVQNPTMSNLTKGYVFKDAIAKRLDEHAKNMFDPELPNILLKHYDMATRWYKAYTLGIFPAYHARNAISNVFNNFITGTTNPMVYKVAHAIQTGKTGTIKTVDGRTIDYDEIRKHLDELGVRNRGFAASDIEQALEAELGNAKWLTLSANSRAVQIGQHVGNAVENNARIAKFIDSLKKGKGFDDAALDVKEALFDYLDLTATEQKIFKRLMPFYTWTRKNVPFQIKHMLQNPGKYKALDTLRQNVEMASDEPEHPTEYLLRDYLTSNYPMRVGWKTVIDPDTGEEKRYPMYFMFGGVLGSGDVWRLASMPTKSILDMVSPLIKGPLEWFFNYDLFKMKELDADRYEDMMGMRVSEPMKKALYNLRLLSTADQIARNLGLYEPTRRLDHTGENDMSGIETMVHFFAGLKTTQVNFDKLKHYYLSDLEREPRKVKMKIESILKAGGSQEEADEYRQKWLDEVTEEAKRARERGGM